jgi:hypothetical protein
MRAVLSLAILATLVSGQSPPVASTNKRLAMYRVFYLPLELTFQPGRDLDSILPYRGNRLLEAHELVTFDTKLSSFRAGLKSKSFLASTETATGKSKRVTPHLHNHLVSFNKSALDGLSKQERSETTKTLGDKEAEVAHAFYQLRLLRNFVDPSEEGLFNFFVVSASWCQSSREYRILLESYFKNFSPNAVLHSVIISGDHKQIFQSPFLKEFFPHPREYSHDSIPRFLAVEWAEGQPRIWEEGEALAELYDRYLAPHRGFLENTDSAKAVK